eukprot:scaffold24860_cov122-Cylindrotheca_fusiformis.AAC.4
MPDSMPKIVEESFMSTISYSVEHKEIIEPSIKVLEARDDFEIPPPTVQQSRTNNVLASQWNPPLAETVSDDDDDDADEDSMPSKPAEPNSKTTAGKLNWFHREYRKDTATSRLNGVTARNALNELVAKERNTPKLKSRPWLMFGGQTSSSAVVERSNGKGGTTTTSSSSSTAIVRRSTTTNFLWNAVRRSVQQSSIWRAATAATRTSKGTNNGSAGNTTTTTTTAAALFLHAIQRPFQRRRQQQQKTTSPADSGDTSQENAKPRRWAGFRQRWSLQKKTNESEESTQDENNSLVPFNPASHPVAVALKKATVGVGGACMNSRTPISDNCLMPTTTKPVPGPGVAMIATGVYVISTEFEFAKNWFDNVKTKYGSVFDRMGIALGDHHVERTMVLPEMDRGVESSVLATMPASLGAADGTDEVRIPPAADASETNDTIAMKESVETGAIVERDIVLPGTNVHVAA